MAEFAPHYQLYKKINGLASISQIAFWSIVVLSIAPVVISKSGEASMIIDVINILNILGITLFFILEIVNDFILIPLADNLRRDDFIDNSFGSTFSPKSSIGYYDNEEVRKGLYKASVNLFENCYFTYNLVKSTTTSKIVIPSIMLVLVAIFGYYGFKEVPIALSILQALFSANILGLLVKHLILRNRLSTIQDSWIALFQNADIKANVHNYQTSIYKYWLQYETLHSKINAGIPEKVYNKLNPSLTKDWEKLKVKYNIS